MDVLTSLILLSSFSVYLQCDINETLAFVVNYFIRTRQNSESLIPLTIPKRIDSFLNAFPALINTTEISDSFILYYSFMYVI